MAENKKSFILYCDFKEVFNELSDQDAGQLIKHIFKYVNDENPVSENPIVKISFIPIKNQLKRDLKEWEDTRHERSESGRAGGLRSGETRRKQAEAKRSTASKNEANEAVTATVTVNVTDTVKIQEGEAATKFSQQVIYNAEETILKNQIEFQRICAGAGISFEIGKDALHKYHLHLEEKEQYPRGKKSVFSGFEKWMINEKNFIQNGTHKQSSQQGSKLGTSAARIQRAKNW